MTEISTNTVVNLSPEFQKVFNMAVKAEMRPIENIENRKKNVEERVNLLSDLLGRLHDVQKLVPNLSSPIAIREFIVTSDDDKIISGTADKLTAEPGSHSLQISELAKSATALSNRLEDKDKTKVGPGFFTFTKKNGEEIEIFIDDENSTLEGICKIINDSNIGVKATVIEDRSDPEEPFRLLINSTDSGAENSIEYSEFYFVDGESDFYIDEEKEPTNAKFTYEGIEIESASNEITNLIKGVTLKLKGISDINKPVSVNIEYDIPKTTIKVKDLVENLNKVFSFIQEQNRLDANSDTMKTLGGDYAIRMTENRIKEALRENFLFESGITTRSLLDLGIQFNKAGLLEFDEKKFEHALQTDFDGVTRLLAGDGQTFGVITKLKNALNSITEKAYGLLSIQKDNYMQRLKSIDDSLKEKQLRANEKIESLKMKLSRTQAALEKFQSQNAQFQSNENSLPAILIK